MEEEEDEDVGGRRNETREKVKDEWKVGEEKERKLRRERIRRRGRKRERTCNERRARLSRGR